MGQKQIRAVVQVARAVAIDLIKHPIDAPGIVIVIVASIASWATAKSK
jgi:FixJ family two-component response regulator